LGLVDCAKLGKILVENNNKKSSCFGRRGRLLICNFDFRSVPKLAYL
jgi:hypothetical protein